MTTNFLVFTPDSITVLRTAKTRSIQSLNSPPTIIQKTKAMLVWLSTYCSWPQKTKTSTTSSIHSSFLLVVSTILFQSVHIQKVPPASHLEITIPVGWALSLSLPTADISAVRGSSHYSWASWSRGFVYFLANGVCLAECSKQFFNKFWVVFQADFCVLWVKSCSVRQDGVQKVYCWRSSQNFVRIAEQQRH